MAQDYNGDGRIQISDQLDEIIDILNNGSGGGSSEMFIIHMTNPEEIDQLHARYTIDKTEQEICQAMADGKIVAFYERVYIPESEVATTTLHTSIDGYFDDGVLAGVSFEHTVVNVNPNGVTRLNVRFVTRTVAASTGSEEVFEDGYIYAYYREDTYPNS